MNGWIRLGLCNDILIYPPTVMHYSASPITKVSSLVSFCLFCTIRHGSFVCLFLPLKLSLICMQHSTVSLLEHILISPLSDCPICNCKTIIVYVFIGKFQPSHCLWLICSKTKGCGKNELNPCTLVLI